VPLLGVAPSGYYDWLQEPVSNRAQDSARLLRLIRASFKCQSRDSRLTASIPRSSRSCRNRLWVTDIIYIRTWKGWLYLAIVMDLFSGKIVGWSTRATIHRQLVLDASMRY